MGYICLHLYLCITQLLDLLSLEIKGHSPRTNYKQHGPERSPRRLPYLGPHLGRLLGVDSQHVLVVTEGVEAVFVLSADVAPQGLKDAMGLQDRKGVFTSRDYRTENRQESEVLRTH